MDYQFYTEEDLQKLNRLFLERDLDGTGPEGKGPRTGRGMGKCPTDEDTEDAIDDDEGIGGGESGEGGQSEEIDDNFEEWFEEQMKKYEFDEGIFDGVKSFIHAASELSGKAKDIKSAYDAGKEARSKGKGLGDVLTIAGTELNQGKFNRAYKEMWLGFNKGLKMISPDLQSKIASDEKVRDAVNTILGNVVEALERGKILKIAKKTEV